MNITNPEYFTFNVDNSMLLIGESGCGKSYLEDKLLERYVSGRSPDELQFVFLDMTGYDFENIIKNHPKYIQTLNNNHDSRKGLDQLSELAKLSDKRAKEDNPKPLLFICIEECDMARIDQKRFDDALIAINTNAKKANMKLIYSTSCIGEQTISERLLKSFDIVLAGNMPKGSAQYVGMSKGTKLKQGEFEIILQDRHTSH